MPHKIEQAADAVERELADLRAKLAQSEADNNGLVELVMTTHENNKALRAKLAVAVEALERIESITVHSGGEIHGVTAHHWQTGFEMAKDEAILALAQINTQGSYK